MRKVALALSLVVCGSMVSAQTLTELAKKERERRKANEKAGKESVVDVTEGNLSEDAKVSRAQEKPKKTQTSTWDPKATRDVVQSAIEKLRAEVTRCFADADRLGVPPTSDLPSCREARRLEAVVRELQRPPRPR